MPGHTRAQCILGKMSTSQLPSERHIHSAANRRPYYCICTTAGIHNAVGCSGLGVMCRFNKNSWEIQVLQLQGTYRFSNKNSYTPTTKALCQSSPIPRKMWMPHQQGLAGARGARRSHPGWWMPAAVRLQNLYFPGVLDPDFPSKQMDARSSVDACSL